MVRGATLACGLAVLCLGCDQPGALPTRFAEPVIAEAGREEPYKSDFGGAPDDLARSAVGWHMPGEPLGRVPERGDTKCVLKTQRLFPFQGERYALVAVWASRDKDCLGETAVVLSLHSETPGPHGGQVIEKVGTSASFGGGMIDTQAAVQAELDALVKIAPIAAGELPPWRPEQLQPDLDEEFTFQPLTDPMTYEAVRKANAAVLCWKTSETRLECTAEADRRRPAQIPLFAVYGYDEFRSMDHAEAIRLLLGGKK